MSVRMANPSSHRTSFRVVPLRGCLAAGSVTEVPLRLAATEVRDDGEPAGIVHAYLRDNRTTLCGLALGAEVIVLIDCRWAERPAALPACPVCLERAYTPVG